MNLWPFHAPLRPQPTGKCNTVAEGDAITLKKAFSTGTVTQKGEFQFEVGAISQSLKPAGAEMSVCDVTEPKTVPNASEKARTKIVSRLRGLGGRLLASRRAQAAAGRPSMPTTHGYSPRGCQAHNNSSRLSCSCTQHIRAGQQRAYSLSCRLEVGRRPRAQRARFQDQRARPPRHLRSPFWIHAPSN
jgi:hypothetical protein